MSCAQDDDVAMQASTCTRTGTQAPMFCGSPSMKPRIHPDTYGLSGMARHMPSAVQEAHFERIADAHCHAHLDKDELAPAHFNELKVCSIA